MASALRRQSSRYRCSVGPMDICGYRFCCHCASERGTSLQLPSIIDATRRSPSSLSSCRSGHNEPRRERLLVESSRMRRKPRASSLPVGWSTVVGGVVVVVVVVQPRAPRPRRRPSPVARRAPRAVFVLPLASTQLASLFTRACARTQPRRAQMVRGGGSLGFPPRAT